MNQAEGYRNELLPRARAEAAELLARADGYRVATVAEASGQAQRFISIESEYRRAPEVTRTRIYLETMEAVMPAVKKVVVGPAAGPVLPYLPLAPSLTTSPERSPRRTAAEPPPPRPARAAAGEEDVQ